MSFSQDVEVSMFHDVDRLTTILSELGDTVSQPNTLPAMATEFIEVRRGGRGGGEGGAS